MRNDNGQPVYLTEDIRALERIAAAMARSARFLESVLARATSRAAVRAALPSSSMYAATSVDSLCSRARDFVFIDQF